jgi:hypothetical protein
VVVGVGAGVGLGVGARGGGDVVVAVGNSSESNFDCSNTTVGCLYNGTVSLGFQEAGSFLVANCTDNNFENPTSDTCDCEVRVPNTTTGNPESCQSCSFGNGSTAGVAAYDCSNLLRGDCVGRDTRNNCISRLRFNTASELRNAVDDYLANNSTGTLVALKYG